MTRFTLYVIKKMLQFCRSISEQGLTVITSLIISIKNLLISSSLIDFCCHGYQLFCCKDYQDLVEYTIENTPLSQYPSEELIDVGPHAPYGSKQARRAAKERAAQRLRDREMARQRAAGTNQANFYACKYYFIFRDLDVQVKRHIYSYNLLPSNC